MRIEVASEAPQDVWRIHLNDVFKSLGMASGDLTDHVAASVAIYCKQFHPQGVQRTDMVLLIARAFCAINERELAKRALVSMRPHNLHVERWLEILSELHHFPALLPYFSCGVIRPADWAGAALDRMWTLDFKRLQLSDDEKHEMMLYRSIRAIVEHMYVFWDSTQGEGILGLKGLASLNVDAGSKKKKSGTLTGMEDLLKYVADLFEKTKVARGWVSVPTLISLDL